MGRAPLVPCEHGHQRSFSSSDSERVIAEEPIEMLDVSCRILVLVERLQSRQFPLDEKRECLDRRCDAQFFASHLVSDKLVYGVTHFAFLEHCKQLLEAHWHRAALALDPAAGEQRTEDVEILLQAYLLATAQIVASVAECHVQIVRKAAARRVELRRKRAELDGEYRVVTIHDR